MKKLIITIAAITGTALAVASGFFISSMTTVSSAVDDKVPYHPENVKVGRYYKENGTQDQYVEVFDDGTIQMFGYDDYWEILYELNGKDKIESYSDEAKQELVDFEKYITSRHEYVYVPEVGYIAIKDMPNGEEGYDHSPYGFVYKNENTIVFSEKSGKVYHYKE